MNLGGKITSCLRFARAYVSVAIQDVKDTRKIVLATRCDALELEIARIVAVVGRDKKTIRRLEKQVATTAAELADMKKLSSELGIQALGLIRTRIPAA